MALNTMTILLTKLAFPLRKFGTNFLRYLIYLKARFVLITLLILGSSFQLAIADESLEEGIKAAYLYKFSSYVDWPSTAFTSPTSPFTLCLLGSNDQFNATLKKIVREESVNGHKIVVNEIRTPEKEAGCHILYIGTTESQDLSTIIDNMRGSNVLTVSDNADQGIIGFTIINNRLRFNIDAAAAAENGLVISSRLLRLAVNVKRRE